LTDLTKGLRNVSEYEHLIKSAFKWATKEGPLMDENIRSVRFNIHDIIYHADSIHRGGGQIIPCARRVFYSSFLTAQPCLMEPISLVEIICPEETVRGGIYDVLNRRRGYVFTEERKMGIYKIRGYLPLRESFGFTDEIRSNIYGQAYPQCVYDHWQSLVGDPLEMGSKINQIVLQIRKHKGLSNEIPPLERFLDKV